MNSDELQRFVGDCIRRSKLSFVPSWIGDAESYTEGARASLIGALTKPYQAEVFVDDVHAHRYETAPGAAMVWIVAEQEPKRLCFDPRDRLFHLAFGPVVPSGKWVDVGHRDKNILDVWMA